MRSVEQLIRSCNRLDLARVLHEQALRCSRDDMRYTSNLLVDMYGRCGSVEEAFQVFLGTDNRNEFSWKLMLQACCVHNSCVPVAIAVFERAPQVDPVSCTCILNLYAQSASSSDLFHFFTSLPARDLVSWNSLISRTPDTVAGKFFFDLIPIRNLVTWNSLLTAYARSGDGESAKELFDAMPERDVKSWTCLIRVFSSSLVLDRMPMCNTMSWNILLAALAEEGHLLQAKSVFNQALQKDIVSWSTLISALRNSPYHMTEANTALHLMPSHDPISIALAGDIDQLKGTLQLDLVSWNVILQSAGSIAAALQVWEEMQAHNLVSWNILLASFAGDVPETLALFSRFPSWSSVSWNTLLRAYSDTGAVEEAKRVFDSGSWERSIVSWTEMAAAYSTTGHIDEANEVLNRMPKHNQLSSGVGLLAYTHLGLIGAAMEVFREMGTRDVQCWNSLMSGCVQGGESAEAMLVFHLMPAWSQASVSAAVAANGQHGNLRGALSVCETMMLQGMSLDDGLLQCLLFSYCHAGSLSEACSCFRFMMDDHGLKPLKEHYCCILDALARAGEWDQAQDLLSHMPFVPDDVEHTSLLRRE